MAFTQNQQYSHQPEWKNLTNHGALGIVLRRASLMERERESVRAGGGREQERERETGRKRKKSSISIAWHFMGSPCLSLPPTLSPLPTCTGPCRPTELLPTLTYLLHSSGFQACQNTFLPSFCFYSSVLAFPDHALSTPEAHALPEYQDSWHTIITILPQVGNHFTFVFVAFLACSIMDIV